MQKIKIWMVGVVALLATVLMSNSVMAADLLCPQGTARAGESVTVASQCSVPKEDSQGGGGLMGIIGKIVQFLIGLAGVIAVFVIIISGIQMATSQGDAQKVAKAKNSLLYAVVGLVIAIVAFAIVTFVLNQVFVK